jgi:hypothetical protein
MTQRVYAIPFKNVSIAGAQDIIGIYAGSAKALEIHEIRLGQTTITTAAQLRVTLRRLPATVTAGTGGSTATPVPQNKNDTAATFTARTNDLTTQASTSGTALDYTPDVWNLVNGYDMLYAPEDRPVVNPNEAFIVSLDQTPSQSMNCSGVAIVAELF